MIKKIFNYFEIAARVAKSKNDERTFLLGAVGIRKDGALVTSLNRPCQDRNYRVHAERLLVRKLDVNAPIVYVVRVRLCDGSFAMAKPCQDCERALKTKGVRRVYYTISNNEYGIINLN